VIYNVSCSWCATQNDATATVCKTCGHNPMVAKEDCECGSCVGLFASNGPVPLPDPTAPKKPKRRRANRRADHPN
jgi:hypothetical protein